MPRTWHVAGRGQTIMLEQWGTNVDNCGVIGLGCERFLAWGLHRLSAGGLSWIERPPKEKT